MGECSQTHDPDGALTGWLPPCWQVGGASLKPEFEDIIKAAAK